MTKFLDGVLTTLERKNLALVLRALLDRYPVIVYSESQEAVDPVSEELVKLIPHRREVVFGSDFISSAEHEQMVNYEQGDYNGERVVFRAPASTAKMVTTEISNFKGWIIATNTPDFKDIIGYIKNSSPISITLHCHQRTIEIKCNGHFKHLSNVTFEKKLLEKITSETNKKMERITRILKRATHGKISNRLEKSLIDLKQEEERVRHSLFREQIQAFVEAAWRAMVILLRLKLLEGVGVNSAISDKMLRQAIDYKGASIERLMDFIRAEWGEDFKKAVQEGRKQSFGDQLEGFWSI